MKEIKGVLERIRYPLLVAVSNKEDIEFSQVVKDKEGALKVLERIFLYHFECEFEGCEEYVDIKKIGNARFYHLFKLTDKESFYPLSKYLLLLPLQSLSNLSRGDFAFLKNWGFNLA